MNEVKDQLRKDLDELNIDYDALKSLYHDVGPDEKEIIQRKGNTRLNFSWWWVHQQENQPHIWHSEEWEVRVCWEEPWVPALQQ